VVKLCPQCGLHVHRSRAKNIREKLIRLLTRYKAYRCHECGWRGWIADDASRRFVDRKKQLRVIVGVLTTVMLALLVIYVIRTR
jgi:uncharacterized protein with PIN domain